MGGAWPAVRKKKVVHDSVYVVGNGGRMGRAD